MIKKILKKIMHDIIAHDYKFIKNNQNPVEMTRKMYRIAKRYDKMRTVYCKLTSKTLYEINTKRASQGKPFIRFSDRLTFNKTIRLLKRRDGPSTIIGTHKNRQWEKQGMDSIWEFKNTPINRVLNHANFF